MESVPPSCGARGGRPGFGLWLLALAALLFSVGCGTAGRERPGMGSDEGLGGSGNDDGGYGYGQPCEADAVRDCSITIEQANGITSCWKGTQLCEEGKWGVCHTEHDATSSLDEQGAKGASLWPAPRVAALTTVPALPCSSNRCDPSCRHYTETPHLTTTTGGGDPPDPPDFTAPGKTLCAHNLCDAGVALDPSCHPCVERVCETPGFEYCCSASWDAGCGAEAVAACPASPTPMWIGQSGGTPGTPAVPGSCDGVPSYVDGGTYVAGSPVQYAGARWTCTTDAYSVRCGQAGWAPASSGAGSLAWKPAGTCTVGSPAIPGVPGTPLFCAIDTELPPVPSFRSEPCRSGLDCQVNQSCKEVVTEAACSHDKCRSGAALSSECDPCVERVCAANPACCATGWSADCVEAVKTECDADCGAPVTACAHGPCTAGGALEASCDACVARVCGSPGFEYCCATGWDEFCVEHARRSCGRTQTVVVPGAGGNLCDYALAGSGTIALKGATVKGGDLGGGVGSIQITAADSVASVLLGNSASQGTVSVWQSQVTGTVKSGGSAGFCNTAIGGCQGNVAVPQVTLPKKTFACAAGAESIPASSVRALAPGNYGNVSVGANATLRLQAGAYRFASLTLESGATLELPSSGNTYLDLCGDLLLKGGNAVTGLALSPAAEVLRFQVYGNGQFTAFPPAQLVGVYQFPHVRPIPSLPGDTEPAEAPYSTFFKKGSSASDRVKLRGLLWSAVTTASVRSEIDAGGVTGEACLGALLDQNVPASCPPLEGPLGRGRCVPNDVGYTDPGLAADEVDLALDMACGDQLTVCNHGRAAAPAGVVVGLYSRAGQQFATERPDENFRIGSCTVPSTIPAGQCTTTTCAASSMSADAFVMVNPDGAVPEFSLLDNWSMHDASADCSGASPRTVSYEYVGECPYASAPAWGLLTWKTSTPGAARATFSARVAGSSAALDAQPFVQVGVASESLGTEECAAFQSCRVDLTEALALGRRQGMHLELQVTVEGAGATPASVELWDISYTCVVDQ